MKTHSCLAFVSFSIHLLLGALQAADPAAGERGNAGLRFNVDGKGFRFDTGWLSGRLHAEGRSQGLSEVAVSGVVNKVSASMGLLSHYRLLDANARYGPAAWDWVSEASLLSDGSVEAKWQSDEAHPFDMVATYRLVAPDTVDVTTRVTARRPLEGFEVFLASYFNGFERSFVRTRADGAERFLEVLERDATWHMFPTDGSMVSLIQDGRWKREPNPVTWAIRDPFAMPLAMRVDSTNDLCGLVMADPRGCFAVATPFGSEPHRSLYLSLFGKTLKIGEIARVRSRLVLAKKLSEAEVMERWRGFAAGLD